MNVISMVSAQMHHTAETVKVESENMANLNTPGYRARTLQPFQFGTTLHNVVLWRICPRHIGNTGPLRSLSRVSQADRD
jgi:flagellar hook protein FlgE